MELGPILRAMQRNKLRFGLIAAQIAVTLAIVANCVALILHVRLRMSRQSSFDDDNLVAVVLPCLDPALRDDERREDWRRENIRRLRGIPGVRSVASTSFIPWWSPPNIEVKPAGTNSQQLRTAIFSADESFPDALGAALDEGRWFTREEVEGTSARLRALRKTKRERTSDGKAHETIVVEAVVSRAFGERVFGEGPLVGKMLERRDGDRYRIIGVLRRYYSPHPSWPIDEYAVIYPGYVHSYEYGSQFMVRTEPGRMAAVVRTIDERLSSTALTYKSVWTVSRVKDIYFGPQQMMAALMSLLMGLFVTSLGIAGLTSFSVAERTRQIGTRRALGATTADILRYFLTEAGLLTTMGLVLGAGLAVLLNMAILTVYTDAKLGAGVVAASALLLWVVGLGAALPPALRGARTSPAIATRNV